MGIGDLTDPDLIWPIVGATLAGAVIGAEREYHGSPAGFRTHILVALSSALLMLAAVHQVRWLSDTPHELIRIDPARMAHGVLTGIGFLCGGVIFRHGVTIHGLTTAASLWTTSALGMLYGVGFHGLAVIGTGATLLVLAAVGLSESHLPRRRLARVTVRFDPAASRDAASVRALLAESGIRAAAIRQALEEGALTFEAVASGVDEPTAERLARALRADPQVVGFDLRPQEN